MEHKVAAKIAGKGADYVPTVQTPKGVARMEPRSGKNRQIADSMPRIT